MEIILEAVLNLFGERLSISYCPHCPGKSKEVIAKYRAAITLSKKEIKTINTIFLRRQPVDGWEQLFALSKYYTAIHYYSKEITIQFVACDRCMDKKLSDYFTYHPDGWIFCSEYEQINI